MIHAIVFSGLCVILLILTYWGLFKSEASKGDK